MYNKPFGIVILILIVFLSGCGSRVDETTVIATVNDEPVYLKELKRELSIRAKQNPSLEIDKETLYDLTDMLVKRRLIIQEAMKKNMAEEERFVDTIKAFWEQTLIRDFVEYKNRQLERHIFVTDKEVKDYYGELKQQDADLSPLEAIYDVIKNRIEQKKKSDALEDWLERKKESAEISLNKKAISELEKK